MSYFKSKYTGDEIEKLLDGANEIVNDISKLHTFTIIAVDDRNEEIIFTCKGISNQNTPLTLRQVIEPNKFISPIYVGKYVCLGFQVIPDQEYDEILKIYFFETENGFISQAYAIFQQNTDLKDKIDII